MPSIPPIKMPIMMITTPKPLLKPDDLKLYKTIPISETKKTVSKPQIKTSVSVIPAPAPSSAKPNVSVTLLSEQGEFENFVKNNLKGLNPHVKLDRLKKMMDCYRENFYRDVPYSPMQTEHHFYDYLVKKRFPELIHYLGLTKVEPKNFPNKKENLKYYLKIERMLLGLARAVDIKDLETFKNILEFSSFQKGLGEYLTGQNTNADQRIVYVLSKGKEAPLSFHSTPVLGEIYKPGLPRSGDELSTEEERKALLHYIKHYFVGKEKDEFLKEIKYTTNAARLHLLWQHFTKSVELRAKADGKEKYLYFEPIVCERISSKAGWRRDPLKSKRKKIVLNFHKGTDLPASEGTPVFNPYPGKVIWLSHDEGTGSGKTIHILHKNGLITRYKHLSKINVLLGDEVPVGRVVAASGDTGVRTTGPHLHYEIVDPEHTFSYRFREKYRKKVGYKTKKIKKNNKWVNVKVPVYRNTVLKRTRVAHTAPINKKTLFVHNKTRLSLKQLITNVEKKYAEYLQKLLALN